MIDKIKIEKLAGEFIKGTDLFLVAVKVSSSGIITVIADKKEGITIDECADMSRFIEKGLSRDDEDYELHVSSPGLDMPFIVAEQYLKNEGRKIEVVDSGGKKYSGILKNVTSGGFELVTEIKTDMKSKAKPVEIKELSFNYDQVKSAREIVTFK
jgi:ribosome maturation factor RimP